jgi:hypothetical protein
VVEDAAFTEAIDVLVLVVPDEDEPNVRFGESTAECDGGLADGIVFVVEIECNATLLALVLGCHRWQRRVLSLKMMPFAFRFNTFRRVLAAGMRNVLLWLCTSAQRHWS